MHPLAVLNAAIYPDAHLLVGSEDDTDGSLRVYLDARYLNLHTHVDDESVKKQIRTADVTATTIHVPAAALCDCPPPATTKDD